MSTGPHSAKPWVPSSSSRSAAPAGSHLWALLLYSPHPSYPDSPGDFYQPLEKHRSHHFLQEFSVILPFTQSTVFFSVLVLCVRLWAHHVPGRALPHDLWAPQRGVLSRSPLYPESPARYLHNVRAQPRTEKEMDPGRLSGSQF